MINWQCNQTVLAMSQERRPAGKNQPGHFQGVGGAAGTHLTRRPCKSASEAQKVWAGFAKQHDAIAFAKACNAGVQASDGQVGLLPAFPNLQSVVHRLSNSCSCVCVHAHGVSVCWRACVRVRVRVRVRARACVRACVRACKDLDACGCARVHVHASLHEQACSE